MTKPPPIFLLTGPPGSGKTTTAEGLASRFERFVHIPVDDIREWVRSGFAATTGQWTRETLRQLGLARKTAAQAALSYHAAGFAVAIVDTVLPTPAERVYGQALAHTGLHKVLLLPPLACLLQRNGSRVDKAADTHDKLQAVMPTSHRNYSEELPRLAAGWQVVDNSAMDAERCVAEILGRCGIPVSGASG